MADGFVIDQDRCGICSASSIQAGEEHARLAGYTRRPGEKAGAGADLGPRLSRIVNDVDVFVGGIKLIRAGTNLGANGVHSEEGVAGEAGQREVTAITGNRAGRKIVVFYQGI